MENTVSLNVTLATSAHTSPQRHQGSGHVGQKHSPPDLGVIEHFPFCLASSEDLPRRRLRMPVFPNMQTNRIIRIRDFSTWRRAHAEGCRSRMTHCLRIQRSATNSAQSMQKHPLLQGNLDGSNLHSVHEANIINKGLPQTQSHFTSNMSAGSTGPRHVTSPTKGPTLPLELPSAVPQNGLSHSSAKAAARRADKRQYCRSSAH